MNSGSITVPAWIGEVDDHVVNLALSMAYLRGSGDIDAESAYAVTRTALAADGERAVAGRLDRVAELVAYAESFEHEPRDAIDAWNVANHDVIAHSDAHQMCRQFRADAIVEAWGLANTRQPQLRVVS